MSTELHRAVETFFTDFARAFPIFDGPLIAERYAVPYLQTRADGVSRCFASTEAIGAHFQEVLDDHRDRGCRACRHRDLEVVPVGAAGAFASVTWELLGADRSVVMSWRESYNLLRSGSRWRICASMDHAT